MTELKYYIIDINKTDMDVISATKEEFIKESEMQHRIYSLETFPKAFNKGKINPSTDYLRIYPFVENLDNMNLGKSI